MGSTYPGLPLFNSPCGANKGSNLNSILIGHNPNPLQSRIIDIKFTALISSEMILSIKSINGKTIATLLDKFIPKGSYTIPFDPATWNVPPGEYIYQLNAAGKTFMRRFNII